MFSVFLDLILRACGRHRGACCNGGSCSFQNMLCSGLGTQQSNLQLRQWASKRGGGASEQVDKDSGFIKRDCEYEERVVSRVCTGEGPAFDLKELRKK